MFSFDSYVSCNIEVHSNTNLRYFSFVFLRKIGFYFEDYFIYFLSSLSDSNLMYQKSFPKGFNQQFLIPSNGPWFDMRDQISDGNFMFIIIINGKKGIFILSSI